MTRLQQLWLAGEAYNPLVPYLVIPLVGWAINYFIRKKWPGAWERFARLGPVSRAASKAWQALPSTMIGAAVGAAATGLDPTDTGLAALAGLVAPVAHELGRAVTTWINKRLPWFPIYYGGKWPAAGSSLPPPSVTATVPPAPNVPTDIASPGAGDDAAPKRDPP